MLEGAGLEVIRNTTGGILGKADMKRCLVIPIDDSGVYLGEKGVYLNLMAVEMQEQRYGDTHFLKQSLPKDMYQNMSDEERRAQPIFGALRPIKSQQRQMNVTQTIDATEVVRDPDDLPF